MTYRLRTWLGFFAFLSLLAPLAGCGGGSGGADTSGPVPVAAPTFSGEYSFGLFGREDTPTIDMVAQWGTSTRDQATGRIGLDRFRNRDGMTTGGSVQYESLEGLAGSFSMWSESPTRPYEGYLTADRRIGAFAASYDDAGPQLGLLMRRATDSSQVQLVDHHLLRCSFVPSISQFSVVRALAPVDTFGQPALSFSGVKNSDGAVGTLGLAGLFGVFLDGGVDASSDLHFRAGGDVAFGAGFPGDTLLLEFLIRPSVGFQATQAAGTYHVFWIERSALGVSLTRGTLTLRADRTGTFERSFINLGGVIITTPSTGAVTMAESTDGSVELTFASTRYGGAFSPSADLAVLVGGLDDGDGPGMMVLLRAE